VNQALISGANFVEGNCRMILELPGTADGRVVAGVRIRLIFGFDLYFDNRTKLKSMVPAFSRDITTVNMVGQTVDFVATFVQIVK
jgi:hypothetical protein